MQMGLVRSYEFDKKRHMIGLDTMRITERIDWFECDDIERIPGKQGGVPLIKGTRIPAEQIVEEAELDSPIEEIAENYPSISLERVRSIIRYAESHRVHLVP